MILIDPPNAEGHGRLWSHLASDESYDELHAFARDLGIPERGFDRDHYDVPAEWYDRVVALGAEPVTSRELVRRLHAAGLRRRPLRAALARPPRGRVRRPPTPPGRTPCGTAAACASRSVSTSRRPLANTSSGRWAYSARTAATYSV